MKGLFIDAGAWYALTDRGHPDHAVLARTLRERVRRGVRIVTTSVVVAETHALLLRRAGRAAALAFVEAVRRPPNRIEYITAEREEEAVGQWLKRFADQRFSLVDACSFAVMSELGIREALTLDGHFAVAGFVVLPGQG